jgi:hypothetical protein
VAFEQGKTPEVLARDDCGEHCGVATSKCVVHKCREHEIGHPTAIQQLSPLILTRECENLQAHRLDGRVDMPIASEKALPMVASNRDETLALVEDQQTKRHSFECALQRYPADELLDFIFVWRSR